MTDDTAGPRRPSGEQAGAHAMGEHAAAWRSSPISGSPSCAARSCPCTPSPVFATQPTSATTLSPALRHPQRPDDPPMPTFVLLARLTPDGVRTVRNNPPRRTAGRHRPRAVSHARGVRDFVSIVEAPDERMMARVSPGLGSSGAARYHSLAAIAVDEFLEAFMTRPTPQHPNSRQC